MEQNEEMVTLEETSETELNEYESDGNGGSGLLIVGGAFLAGLVAKTVFDKVVVPVGKKAVKGVKNMKAKKQAKHNSDVEFVEEDQDEEV